jgi:hypothetical protein
MSEVVSRDVAENLLGEVCEGQASPYLTTLYQRGLIPSSGGLNLQQLLAVAVARGLRASGVPFEQCALTLRFLWELPTERLEADFKRGAFFLCVIGNRLVLPRLVTREAVEFDETARLVVHLDQDQDLRPVLLNVHQLAKRLRVLLKKP